MVINRRPLVSHCFDRLGGGWFGVLCSEKVCVKESKEYANKLSLIILFYFQGHSGKTKIWKGSGEWRLLFQSSSMYTSVGRLWVLLSFYQEQ